MKNIIYKYGPERDPLWEEGATLSKERGGPLMTVITRVVKANRIINVNGSVALIEVTHLNGRVVHVLIDAEGIPKVKRYRWYSHKGYCCTAKNGHQWYVTWELFGRPEEGQPKVKHPSGSAWSE